MLARWKFEDLDFKGAKVETILASQSAHQLSSRQTCVTCTSQISLCIRLIKLLGLLLGLFLVFTISTTTFESLLTINLVKLSCHAIRRPFNIPHILACSALQLSSLRENPVIHFPLESLKSPHNQPFQFAFLRHHHSWVLSNFTLEATTRSSQYAQYAPNHYHVTCKILSPLWPNSE